MPNIAMLSSFVAFGATPAVPILSYTAQSQFTITNYDSTLQYSVTGGSRLGNIINISNVGTTATVSAKYPRSTVSSENKSLLTAAYARVLYGPGTGVGSAGCGSRYVCCPSGMIHNTNGDQCLSGGTQGCFAECCGTCADCTGLFLTCYNWYWTDYTGSGYTLLGSVWGKVQ